MGLSDSAEAQKPILKYTPVWGAKRKEFVRKTIKLRRAMGLSNSAKAQKTPLQ